MKNMLFFYEKTIRSVKRGRKELSKNSTERQQERAINDQCRKAGESHQ
jgi:hypothetical protein